MKHVVKFATISACLLVLSGGAALAAEPPHNQTSTGQPGNNPAPGAPLGANCGTTTTSSPSPQAAIAPGSPFNTTTPGVAGGHYAGAGENTETNASSKAFSNYDVACFQASQPH